VGKQLSVNKNHIVWGRSQRAPDVYGSWPAVAISKEGYVVVVHSTVQYADNSPRSGSEQYYRIGKIDPNGHVNQSISWKTDLIHWDGGYHTSIAINDTGLIVGVHESNARQGTGLYYRVGQLRNPAGGDYTIAWSSGSTGVNYDYGINPHIAINNHNQVVEVHQVTNESLLHYRRGTVSEGKINFAASQRYDNDAKQPAVALLDSGLVLEVHSRDGLYSRTGKLDPSNSTLIEWSPSVKNGGSDSIEYPALATSGEYAFGIIASTAIAIGILIEKESEWIRFPCNWIIPGEFVQIVASGKSAGIGLQKSPQCGRIRSVAKIVRSID
jgi:hypothetical protein